MKSKLWKIILSLLLAGAGVFALAIWLLDRGSMFNAVTVKDSLPTHAIEQLGGFSMPANAEHVESHYVSWLDYELWVRFDLPPGARDEFLSHLQPDAVTETAFGEMSPKRGMPWWTPPDVGDHRVEIERRGGGVRQHIVMDESDPQRLVVYLYAANDENGQAPTTQPAATTMPRW